MPYSGGETVTWTVFDSVKAFSGLGCYQDDLLFALTWSNPLHPVPYYLYTWNLDASGIPLLPADVYELGAPFIGSLGGCEWDGEYLWIVDNYMNFDGPGFFVGNWFASTVDFYDHDPMILESSTWGCIKAGFDE